MDVTSREVQKIARVGNPKKNKTRVDLSFGYSASRRARRWRPFSVTRLFVLTLFDDFRWAFRQIFHRGDGTFGSKGNKPIRGPTLFITRGGQASVFRGNQQKKTNRLLVLGGSGKKKKTGIGAQQLKKNADVLKNGQKTHKPRFSPHMS